MNAPSRSRTARTMASGRSSVSLVSGLGVCVAVAAAAVLLLNVPRTPEALLDRYAQDYVVLALSLDRIKSGEVDSYFGPAALRDEADNDAAFADIAQRAGLLSDELIARLDESSAAEDIPVELYARSTDLLLRIGQLQTVAASLAAANRASFADELLYLYGVTVPEEAGNAAADARAELDQLLPGRGTLAFRLASFHNKLIIPPDKRRIVFEAALAECRRRTQQHWQLPEDEQLDIEWTREVSAAWHQYRGSNRSTLRLNDLTIAVVSHAVDLACHEAYPGHHAQFLLMDAVAKGDATAEGGALPVEAQLALLRTPGSLLREGAANFGVELVFSPEERLAFERDELFPLAGLPSEQAEVAARVHVLVTQLSSAVVPVIRTYYDGDIDFNAASWRLERDAMIMSPLPLLEFVDEYGTYSMGYTLVRDRMRQHTSGMSRSQAWQVLAQMLTGSPSDALAQLQHFSIAESQ